MHLPITKPLLGLILDNLDDLLDDQPKLRELYKVIFSMSYHGLLRIGELVTGNHPILVTDVHQGKNKDKLQIVLRSSKMHTRADPPQTIKIESIKSKDNKKLVKLTDNPRHCLNRIVDSYIKIRDKYQSKNEPFFIFPGRHLVRPASW